MDIFEFAMQMEKDGENYYRQLAQNVANKGIKTILTMLADEEVKHYTVLAKIQTQRPGMAETIILADAKSVFQQMKESGEKLELNAGQAGRLADERDQLDVVVHQHVVEEVDAVRDQLRQVLGDRRVADAFPVVVEHLVELHAMQMDIAGNGLRH